MMYSPLGSVILYIITCTLSLPGCAILASDDVSCWYCLWRILICQFCIQNLSGVKGYKHHSTDITAAICNVLCNARAAEWSPKSHAMGEKARVQWYTVGLLLEVWHENTMSLGTVCKIWKPTSCCCAFPQPNIFAPQNYSFACCG